MSKSTHQVAIKGVDQTGAAFKSISNRAKATGAQIRSIMGGAIAAAGAYLSFRSIKSGRTLEYTGKSSVDSRGVRWYRVKYHGSFGWVSSRYSKKQ